jgi:hypothetical protein
MMKARVVELLGELGLRPDAEHESLTDLTKWILQELRTNAAADPRTGELVEIAHAWLAADPQR